MTLSLEPHSSQITVKVENPPKRLFFSDHQMPAIHSDKLISITFKKLEAEKFIAAFRLNHDQFLRACDVEKAHDKSSE
jgi:hypothetical protein